MKHLSIVPLIGGMAIGAENALGVPPEAVLSYDGFWGNDKYLMAWYEKRGLDIPYYNLDSDTIPAFSEVDVVSSLCPCAGLTSANAHASASCASNTWMLKSAQWAMEYARPRVIIGENASRLFTSFGQPIATTMKKMADIWGYHLTLIKTDTKLHGLPQKRPRSFFVLYRKDDNRVPLLALGGHTPYDGTWIDFLNTFPTDEAESERRWAFPEMYEFISEKMPNWAAGDPRGSGSVMETIFDNDWVDEFCDKYPGKEADRVVRAKNKFAMGLSVWDGTAKKTGDYFAAVNFRNSNEAVHPIRHDSPTWRELMRLMGLPETMDVPTENPNAIAQNVPTCTSEWIVKSAMDSLAGKNGYNSHELKGDGILRQNNVNSQTRYGMEFGRHYAEHGMAHIELVRQSSKQLQPVLT